jgi:hypothetical protein
MQFLIVQEDEIENPFERQSHFLLLWSYLEGRKN